jgi:hypothetical protein
MIDCHQKFYGSENSRLVDVTNILMERSNFNLLRIALHEVERPDKNIDCDAVVIAVKEACLCFKGLFRKPHNFFYEFLTAK